MTNARLIVVGIATLKRGRLLRDALDSLSQTKHDGFRIEVVVADNDPLGSARAPVESAGASLPFPVTYYVEGYPGVSAPLNKLVDHAKRVDARYIAFIDDDQLVDSHWLQHLFQTAESTQATAVQGCVIPRFEDGVAEWVKQWDRWYWPQPETGTSLRYIHTGNLLLRVADLESIAGPFDLRYGMAGGEDTMLSEELHSRGLTAVFSQQSKVYERILPSRGNAKGMINISYREGWRLASVLRMSRPPVLAIVRRALKSAGQTFVGGSQFIVAIPFGKPKYIPALSMAARGAGGLLGLVAYRPDKRDLSNSSGVETPYSGKHR